MSFRPPRRPPNRSSDASRSLTFETLEVRRVFDADVAIESPGMLEAAPTLAVEDAPVELVDVPTGVADGPGEVEALLNQANAATGLNYVREQYGFDGSGQTVAIIDTGIAWDHLALGGGYGAGHRVVGGWDFAENDANPYDDAGGWHGTHVAGIVGSTNATYRGVAPGADLVGLRVFDDAGAGHFGWVEQALDWVIANRLAFENPITTVNLSLGSAYNGTTLPGWDMLEDEFAALDAAGVVVLVAAGNDFEDYGTPGLSYPAVSQHVIPVSAVNDAGSFASFSQRHDRAIAAPGDGIVSTVPDHLFGTTNHNAFGGASGTSMASPYLAGASALAREALEFAGRTGIDREMIYDLFRDTADVFWDAATSANYRRLDLAAAIDAANPDEYGSTSATAAIWNPLAGGATFAGAVQKISDLDFVRFTASDSGSLRIAATETHSLDLVVRVNGVAVAAAGGAYTLEVEAGETYVVSLGTSAGIGRYSLTSQFTESDPFAGAVNLGVVGDRSFLDQSDSNGRVYRVEAARDGLLTVQALFSASNGNLDLAVYSADGTLLASQTRTGDHERIDATVVQGEDYFVVVTGTSTDFDLRIANVVERQGSTLHAYGSAAQDAFDLRTTGSSAVFVNGLRYQLSTFGASTVQVHAGGGTDTLWFYGSAANESATLENGAATLNFAGGSLVADSVEKLRFEGGGGTDSATLYDTAGNDQFFGESGTSLLWGAGYSIRVNAIDHVTVAASRGGIDVAVLYGTSSSETLVASPTSAQLSYAGASITAQQFDKVFFEDAFADADSATLTGSAGADDLSAAGAGVTFRGTNFYLKTTGAENVIVDGAAGADRALLYGSGAGDEFSFMPTETELTRGNGLSIVARDFARVEGFAGDADDRATMLGSSGADQYYASVGKAVLYGPSFQYRAYGFSTYDVDLAGGANVAYFTGGAGSESAIVDRDEFAWTDSTGTHTVEGATTAYAYFNGGNDSLTLTGLTAIDSLFAQADLLRWRDGTRDFRWYDMETADAFAANPADPATDIRAIDYLFSLQ